MKDRAAPALQAVTSLVSVVHLAVTKLQTPETVKRVRRSNRLNSKTLTSSSLQSLLSTASSILVSTTVSSLRAALLSFYFLQAGEIEIDIASRTAHLFWSSSTPLEGIAAIFTSKKAERRKKMCRKYDAVQCVLQAFAQFFLEVKMYDTSCLDCCVCKN